jgi:hypothetical protein
VRKVARTRPRDFDSNRARKVGRKIPKQEIPTPRGRPYVPIHRTYTPELIANGRRRYEETAEPVSAIAADFRIHPGSLRRLAGQLGWVRFGMQARDLPEASRLLAQAEALEASMQTLDRHPEARAQRASKGDGQYLKEFGRSSFEGGLRPPPQDDGESLSPEHSPATVDALEREVRAQLALVTAARERLQGLPPRPREGEASSRALSNLTTTLQKIQLMRCGLNPSDNHDNDLPADLDAFRDELARRIDAFVASRTDARDAVADAGPAGVAAVR